MTKIFYLIPALFITACSSSKQNIHRQDTIAYQGTLNDPIMVITLLSEQQRDWAHTPYLLGGKSKRGIDCSAFTQKTFKERFNVNLPRTTVEQARQGKLIPRSQIETGDLVFFKTGRGPRGYHVGIYVKDGQFLHASTKGGVIYSSLNSPYWSRTFWQARRI